MIISIINNTQLMKEDVQRTIRAVNRQLAEDFKRYWHRDVELRLEGWTGEQPDPDTPLDMRGDAVLYLWDQDDVEDALGYHARTAAGVPFGFVFTQLSIELGEAWSVTLSHEVLEMAMDPEVNLLAQGPHPDPDEDGRTVYHWYELCDAVQAVTYKIDEVDVANFVLPLYFTEGDEQRNHNDFLGTSLPSFGVSNGGYVGFFDPETGRHGSWSDPRDSLAARRRELKQKFQGVQRSGRHAGGGDTSPIGDTNLVNCDAIIFEIVSESGESAPLAWAEALAARELGKEWTVERSAGDPNEFDAIYRGAVAVGFSEAWDLAHRLAERDTVVFAEPSLSHPVVGETEDGAPIAPEGLRASGRGGSHLPGTDEPAWGLELCKVPGAWNAIEAAGQLPGEGVRIGHPDSGYRKHREMDPSRVLSDIDYDFVDRDDNPRSSKGNHGLSTASVIMSGHGGDGDRIKGPALHSQLVPLRVTKPGWIRPAPVLIGGGMRRLRDAIDYSVKSGCAVISMSLGGLPSRAVKKAVGRATDAGLIVLAAAGNHVRFVVWPAQYDAVVAVAGCNIRGEAWDGSSHGEAVDITAPAESVWRAYYTKKDRPDVARSAGTSYAVALTAGVAALWVGFHGRDELAETYGAHRVHEVFRDLLQRTANRDHGLPKEGFGAGIVDAQALLDAPLPSPSHMRRARVGRDDLADAIRQQGLEDALGVDPYALSEGFALELLGADVLGAIPARGPGDDKRSSSARRASVRPRGLSSRLTRTLAR